MVFQGRKVFAFCLSSFIQTLLSVAESHCICLSARGLFFTAGREFHPALKMETIIAI
jgi:hypothetical protein